MVVEGTVVDIVDRRMYWTASHPFITGMSSIKEKWGLNTGDGGLKKNRSHQYPLVLGCMCELRALEAVPGHY